MGDRRRFRWLAEVNVDARSTGGAAVPRVASEAETPPFGGVAGDSLNAQAIKNP